MPGANRRTVTAEERPAGDRSKSSDSSWGLCGTCWYIKPEGSDQQRSTEPYNLKPGEIVLARCSQEVTHYEMLCEVMEARTQNEVLCPNQEALAQEEPLGQKIDWSSGTLDGRAIG